MFCRVHVPDSNNMFALHVDLVKPSVYIANDII